MSELTGQTNPGSFQPADSGSQSDAGINPVRAAGIRKTSASLLKATRRKATMAYLLEELQQPAKQIPDMFDSVDRRLPAPPAQTILQRAIGTCLPHFVEFSEQARAVQDSRDYLLEAICGLADENQRQECAKAMSEFETRMIASASDSAVAEINNSYLHIARLLQEEANDRSLPWQSRLLAASHFLTHAAKPETLCQGNKIGSQIICLIQKLVVSKPASLAEIMTSVALNGCWSAFDGKNVTVEEHSLKPGIDEITYKSGENQRSYAAKILQCVLMNNCLRRRSRPMVYSETPGRPGRDYGGQVIRTKDGEQINPKFGANLTYLELALLARYQFGQESCVIVNDASFASQSPESADARTQQNLLIHIQSSDDLFESLMKTNLPVMIAVSERRLLAESYNDGINHCVNIVANNGCGTLKIFNPQLLPGMGRVARISVEKLYNASLSAIKTHA